MKNLLLDKGGLTLSEDIDFGSHQMTTPASLFGLYPSHLEPLASLVARMQPSHTGKASAPLSVSVGNQPRPFQPANPIFCCCYLLFCGFTSNNLDLVV